MQAKHLTYLSVLICKKFQFLIQQIIHKNVL